MTSIHLIQLDNCTIFQQLQLEEALLRSNDLNYCIINSGSTPAIVLGISSTPEEMLSLNRVRQLNMPMIQRFSGGGTVVIDQDTLFVTFIFNTKDINVQKYPEPILRWGEEFYKNAFDHSGFSLIENDYVLGHKKIGGNALYLRKNRWLLHTSFLWDYQDDRMDLLKFPKKRPDYRRDRPHNEFITRLKLYYSTLAQLKMLINQSLKKTFNISSSSSSYPLNLLEKPHRKSTRFLN